MSTRISLTTIVKNEAATLATCLDSVKDIVDEMVIVDTGSTDRTRDIADLPDDNTAYVMQQRSHAASRPRTTINEM